MTAKKTSSIADLVKGVIKQLGGKSRFSEEEIRRTWADAAGDKAAGHTKPISIRRSVLLVNVDGSGWLYELAIRKKEILKKLEVHTGKKKIKDIRLRIGEIK